MQHIISRIYLTLAGLAASGLAIAGAPPTTPPGTIPEPSVLGLLAIGGVVGAIVAIRNRRK